jgi:hypothetical protein
MSLNSSNNIVLAAPRPVRLGAGHTPAFSPVISTRAGAAAFRVLSAAPSDALERLKLADDSQDSKDIHQSQSDTVSPRASPRYVFLIVYLCRTSRNSPPLSANLPSEALEEFLSILRPASLIYPSTSPILRATARRNNAPISVIPYERPHPYKRDRSENGAGKSSQSPSPSRSRICVTPFKSWSPEEKREFVSDDYDREPVWYPFEWPSHDPLRTYYTLPLIRAQHRFHALFISIDSPVNRSQARNPFNRHASCDPDSVAGQVLSHMALPSDSSPSPKQFFFASLAPLSPAAIPLPSPSPEEAMELDSIISMS